MASTELEFGFADDREIYARLSLAKEAHEFFKSSIGMYVLGCAEQEIRKAIGVLLEADPVRDVDKIAKAQERIKIVRLSIDWLNELVSTGEAMLQAGSISKDIEP